MCRTKSINGKFIQEIIIISFSFFMNIIVCQVIAMMSIIMVGGIYCPLSPRDPQYRLHTLIQQTQSRLVLVHSSTKTKFNNNSIISLNIDSVLFENNVDSDIGIDQ